MGLRSPVPSREGYDRARLHAGPVYTDTKTVVSTEEVDNAGTKPNMQSCTYAITLGRRYPLPSSSRRHHASSTDRHIPENIGARPGSMVTPEQWDSSLCMEHWGRKELQTEVDPNGYVVFVSGA